MLLPVVGSRAFPPNIVVVVWAILITTEAETHRGAIKGSSSGTRGQSTIFEAEDRTTHPISPVQDCPAAARSVRGPQRAVGVRGEPHPRRGFESAACRDRPGSSRLSLRRAGQRAAGRTPSLAGLPGRQGPGGTGVARVAAAGDRQAIGVVRAAGGRQKRPERGRQRAEAVDQRGAAAPRRAGLQPARRRHRVRRAPAGVCHVHADHQRRQRPAGLFVHPARPRCRAGREEPGGDGPSPRGAVAGGRAACRRARRQTRPAGRTGRVHQARGHPAISVRRGRLRARSRRPGHLPQGHIEPGVRPAAGDGEPGHPAAGGPHARGAGRPGLVRRGATARERRRSPGASDWPPC